MSKEDIKKLNEIALKLLNEGNDGEKRIACALIEALLREGGTGACMTKVLLNAPNNIIHGYMDEVSNRDLGKSTVRGEIVMVDRILFRVRIKENITGKIIDFITTKSDEINKLVVGTNIGLSRSIHNLRETWTCISRIDLDALQFRCIESL